MSSPATPSQQKTMIQFENLKSLKPFRFLNEPLLGITGVFFFSICVFCCFFYFDYRNTVVKGLRFTGLQSERFNWLKIDNGSTITVAGDLRKRVDYLDENCNGCDVFDGDWIWDESYPLYLSKDCRVMDDGFRCSENGRPDLFYTKWRWQPKTCNLPRFDARLMLEKLRNRRLAFVGDSIGRNQWESLLCMLSSAISNKDSIYEVNGNPITNHKGFLVFKFKDFNCTVEYYRAPYLVVRSRPPPGSSPEIKTTLKLDQMDWSFLKWRNADVIVFNTGHWWNYEKTVRGGCYFQEGAEVKTEMDVDTAFRRAMETVMNWVHKEVDPNKTHVFFRTFAPVHFRGGNWKTGGTCHLEKLPDLRSSSFTPSQTPALFRIIKDMITTFSNTSNDSKLDLLNITGMSLQRKDGHSSIYYLGPNVPPAPLHRQDCSHWCLPGVPDAWNELLFALFLKSETTRVHKSSFST